MVQTVLKRTDLAFDGRDLDLCQHVFDAVCSEAGITRSSEEGERLAAIVVELYRQGVRNPDQLRPMVEAARGIKISSS